MCARHGAFRSRHRVPPGRLPSRAAQGLRVPARPGARPPAAAGTIRPTPFARMIPDHALVPAVQSCSFTEHGRSLHVRPRALVGLVPSKGLRRLTTTDRSTGSGPQKQIMTPNTPNVPICFPSDCECAREAFLDRPEPEEAPAASPSIKTRGSCCEHRSARGPMSIELRSAVRAPKLEGRVTEIWKLLWRCATACCRFRLPLQIQRVRPTRVTAVDHRKRR
jgi:hypothetical protein